MFGLSSELIQESAVRTWSCVTHFANLLWYKLYHLRQPIMPRSRRRHHSRSRSRSRSHSHDRDREPKRRRVENPESPQNPKSSTQNTPQKPLTPMQIQKRNESEKKRALRQQEKEERDKKKQEEKDEREKKKREEKEEKERQRLKEKEEKEKEKQKERETRQKEKDERKKEKEEKEEMKRKEREGKEESKRKEIGEKERKRLLEVEQKEKAAMVFSKFFVPKKVDTSTMDDKQIDTIFMPFPIKPDMRIAPTCRRILSDDVKDTLTNMIRDQPTGLNYVEEVKKGKAVGKSDKTWVDENNDVMIINEEDSIIPQERKVEKIRAKMLKFHENRRPAFFGTWRKRSKLITARKPFNKDTELFDYEVDSDDDWEEEDPGESLHGSDDEDKDNVSENDYEEDNEFFVPHGYLSDGEGEDEDNVPMSPETHKAKLKLLKSNFEEEINSKTERLKPRLIGCIWEEKTIAKIQDAIQSILETHSMIINGPVTIKKRDANFLSASTKKSLSERKNRGKLLNKELVPTFLQLVHGNTNKKMVVVNEFLTYLTTNSLSVEVNKRSLSAHMGQLATWMKCPDEGPMFNKSCWYVNEDVRQQYNADLSIPNKWNASNDAVP